MERGKKRLKRLRARRMKAVALFEQGERQATVASPISSVKSWSVVKSGVHSVSVGMRLLAGTLGFLVQPSGVRTEL
jgi:hypothetical protein